MRPTKSETEPKGIISNRKTVEMEVPDPPSKQYVSTEIGNRKNHPESMDIETTNQKGRRSKDAPKSTKKTL